MSRARRGSAGRVLAAALGLLALAACAKSVKQPDVTADRPGTPVDSVTVALWRMDETGGTHAADAGPSRLDAIAGPDTRTIFGRFRGARLFTRSTNSFLYVPYSPLLDLAVGAQHRGLDRPERLHAVRGLPHRQPGGRRRPPSTAGCSPSSAPTCRPACGPPSSAPAPAPRGTRTFVQGVQAGRLLFVFQPEDAGAPRVFYSLSAIELQRWTHVAVTFDGQVVRFFVNGQPDGTFATAGRIRASQAPLLVGNFFDPRFLTDFGGDLRQGPAADTAPWYALDGGIDELRLSRAARTEFPLHGGR